MKKAFLLVLAVIASVLWFAAPASAHTPSVTADCDSLEIRLTNYNGVNWVTTIIDGVVVTDPEQDTFGTSYTDSRSFDPYVAHTYKVKVRAHDDPTGERGWSNNFTGTTTPCERPIPEQPEPRVETEQWDDSKCTLPNDGTVTTTRWAQATTWSPVWDEQTWTWVDGEPVVGDPYIVETLVTDGEECAVITPTPTPTPTESTPTPTPTVTTPAPTPSETPVVTQVHTVATPTLAETGTSRAGLWVISVTALLLVAAGAWLVIRARRANAS